MKLTPETISGKIGRKIDINTIEEIVLDSLGFTEVSSFQKFKALKKLDLSSNRMQLIRHIKGLFDLPVIENLNLTSNPVTKQQNYRIIVIKNLPTLLVLDEKPITATERNQAREFDESNATKDPLSRKVDEDNQDQDQELSNNNQNTQDSSSGSEATQVLQRNDQDNEKEEQTKKLDEDSLFGSKTHKKLIFEDDEEISLDSISLSSLEKKKVEKKPAAKSSLIFEDDGDDIFANIKKPTSKKSNDLDDDLFGDTSKDSKENLSSDFDISSYIQSNKNRSKNSLFD